ncbi:MAG: radical SAM protein [Acidocella sp.]|nr:radical SAM protein [Acidocella sp.]
MDVAVTRVQGYVDERSTHHVSGWLRDLDDPARRLGFEVVLPGLGGGAEGEEILAMGVADAHSDVLVQVGVGDGGYAFRVMFARPLSPEMRDEVFVRPAGLSISLELAPALRIAAPAPVFQGYVDERSVAHVSGWVRDLADPKRRVDIEIVLPEPAGERVLQRLCADQYNETVRAVGVGDGCYAFFARFDTLLSEAERDLVFVRPAGSTHRLELAPGLNERFEPVHHVAMDIVDNCNLRCPFCVYDYSETRRTNFMSEAVFAAALRLIPYVSARNFWLSCLHEATMHPRLLDLIRMVPTEYREKLFFTTNLAKRLPASFFEGLAGSGISHITVSVESLVPEIYERMRKGARFGIFQENWDRLLAAFGAHPNPPQIRYNMMAYRSNLREIPALVSFLREQAQGWEVEIRNTFDEPHIPLAFREAEFLTTAEWEWLAQALAHWPRETVILLLPPSGLGYEPKTAVAAEVPAEPPVARVETARRGPVPKPYNLRISWDGTLNVYAELPRQPGEPPTHVDYLVTNILDLADPIATLFAL